MSVVTATNPTIGTETAPTGAENVWSLSRLFIADWANGFEVTNTWPVTIGAGQSSSEKRACQTGRPLRTLRFSVSSTIPAETWLLKNLLRRMGICRSLVPLYCDYTTLTAAASSTTLTCDTPNRRFFPGARIALATPLHGTAAYQDFQQRMIVSVASGSITINTAPTHTYAVGSRVIPLLECDLWIDPSAKNNGGGKMSIDVLATEVPGASSLLPLASAGDTLAFSTYTGYPIFDPGINRNVEWLASEDGWKRDNVVSQLGQGRIYQLFGQRPRATSKREVTATTRADAWNLLMLWDFCRGPTLPFFAVAPLPYFDVRAITTTTIQVAASGPLEDWSDYPYIAVGKRQAGSGSVRVRPISSVTRASSIDTITVSDAFDSMALSDVIYVAPANLMRFDSPDLNEKWTNSQTLSLSFSLVEVLNEETVALINL